MITKVDKTRVCFGLHYANGKEEEEEEEEEEEREKGSMECKCMLKETCSYSYLRGLVRPLLHTSVRLHARVADSAPSL